MTQSEIQAALNEQHSIVLDREARLKNYDYIGTKIAMGVATTTQYKDAIAETEVLRADINAAQQRIAELEAEVPEDAEGEPEGSGSMIQEPAE